MTADYCKQIHPVAPRHWDYREWKYRGVLMLNPEHPDTFTTLRYYDTHMEDLIVIFIGRQAEKLRAAIDPSRHDVRDTEPFFLKDDFVDWRIS